MGKTFHPYFVGQNAAKKVFRPWYRPGSEASRSGEAAADDAATDDADPDQSAVVVRPLETLDLAASGTPGEKVFRSVTLAEMRARRKNVRSVTREEIMRPREVRPWFRPGDPRAVEYWRTKSNTINQPDGITRLYPEYYHGLIGDTFIRITSKRDDRNTKLRLIIGPTEYCGRVAFENLESHEDYDFDGGSGYEVAKLVLFRKGEENNIVKNKFPNHLLGDTFDHVRLEVQGNRTIRLRRVEIKLNGITLLNKDYDNVQVPLVVFDEAIRQRRLKYVDHSTNPIIRAAADEIGKSWSPRYGNVWEKMSDPKPIWCSEFASWAIKLGTNGRIDPNENNHSIGDPEIISYLRRRTGFITSALPPSENILDHPIQMYVVGFGKLMNLIRSGYYIPMSEQKIITSLGQSITRGGVHSGLFCKWRHKISANELKMLTIEGNNGDVVNTAERILSTAEHRRQSDVLWDKTRIIPLDSMYRQFVYDGFGITS